MKFDDNFYDVLCPTTEPLTVKFTKTGAIIPTLSRVDVHDLKHFFTHYRLALRNLPGKGLLAEGNTFETHNEVHRHHTIVT